MAELLHAEDVIFNKPSLKEFIRLIKNGTINEIWPSTQDEFNWWNGVGGYIGQEPGYRQYINPAKELTEDKLKLKSIKTAVTIFYGDNEDSAASSTLNLNATTANFSALKLKIEGDPTDGAESWQEKIVNLNYFDSDSDLQYPKLTLNESTGEINKEEVDSHKQILESRFRENYNYWLRLEDKIKNFTIGSNNNYSLSKANIEKDYYNFFDNSKNGINLDRHIEELNTSYILDNILIDPNYNIQDSNNNYFYFENFKKLIEEYNKKIYNTEQILKKYSYSLDTTIFNARGIVLTDKADYFADMLSNLNMDISTFIGNIAQDNSILYPKITNYYINNINSTDYSTYNSLITFIDDYKNLYKQLLILQAKGYSTGIASQVAEEIAALKQNLQELQNEQGKTSSEILSAQIDLINTNYITKINNIIIALKSSTDIRDKIDNYTPLVLIYGYDPYGLHNATTTVNRLQEFYNIIIAELQIIKQYVNVSVATKMTEEEYIDKFETDIIDTIFTNILLEQYRIDEGETMPLEKGIKEVKKLLEEYLNSYNDLIEEVKILGFTCIDPQSSFEIDQTNKIVSNKAVLLEDLTKQYNKSIDYVNMILTINPETSLPTQKLNTDYQTLSSNLEEVYVVVTAIGSADNFNEWVNTNFDTEKIAKTIKYLSNNASITASDINTNNYIPAPSADFLSISNKTTLLTNYETVRTPYQSRLGQLLNIFEEIKVLLYSWAPTYDSSAIRHYICINVGSFIQFPNESTAYPYDGALSIVVDEAPHYPLINGLANNINAETSRNSQIPTIGGLKSIFGQNFDKIGTKSAGGPYQSIYLADGEFKVANVIAGTFGTLKDNSSSGWQVTNINGHPVSIQAAKVFGAVYNDYAEYRSAEVNPGRCIIEQGDGTLTQSTKRLQLGANIVSDTFGFAIGETDEAKCPVAVCGRVLAYPLEDRNLYTPGAAVCSGPEGTVSLMTREEIKEWPDAIVGYVSEVPTYDTWGSDNTPVNGRIWIKIK